MTPFFFQKTLGPKPGATLATTARKGAIGGAGLSAGSQFAANGRDVKIGNLAGAIVTGAVSGALFGSTSFLTGGANVTKFGGGEAVGVAVWKASGTALSFFGTSKIWTD